MTHPVIFVTFKLLLLCLLVHTPPPLTLPAEPLTWTDVMLNSLGIVCSPMQLSLFSCDFRTAGKFHD